MDFAPKFEREHVRVAGRQAVLAGSAPVARCCMYPATLCLNKGGHMKLFRQCADLIPRSPHSHLSSHMTCLHAFRRVARHLTWENTRACVHVNATEPEPTPDSASCHGKGYVLPELCMPRPMGSPCPHSIILVSVVMQLCAVVMQLCASLCIIVSSRLEAPGQACLAGEVHAPSNPKGQGLVRTTEGRMN